MEEEFGLSDVKDPNTREEELLQHIDQALSVIYEALDPKVFCVHQGLRDGSPSVIKAPRLL